MGRWDGIDEFVAVARTGSFTRAATGLGVSSSFISREVAKLEQRLQAQLLIRTPRTVTLTAKGSVLLDHCRRLILERDEALAIVCEDGEPSGELHLTCGTTLGEQLVVPIIRDFCEQNPKLSVVIQLTNRLVDLVREGVDLAIRTGQLSDSRLVGTKIAARSFATCAAPGYLDRMGRPATLDELSSHECVIGTSATWYFLEDGVERQFQPKGRWRCNSGSTVVDAAVAGMGVCHLPEAYLRQHIEAKKLEVILAPFRPEPEPIWGVYPQQRHRLPKVRDLIEYLKSKLPAAMDRPMT